EDVVEILELAIGPPFSRRPCRRQHVDLFDAGQLADAVSARRRIRTADAAVELNAKLILFRGIVTVRDIELIRELVAANTMRQLAGPVRHVAAIRPAFLQSGECIIEGHTALDDEIDGFGGAIRRARVPELLKRLINRGGCRGKQSKRERTKYECGEASSPSS